MGEHARMSALAIRLNIAIGQLINLEYAELIRRQKEQLTLQYAYDEYWRYVKIGR